MNFQSKLACFGVHTSQYLIRDACNEGFYVQISRAALLTGSIHTFQTPKYKCCSLSFY